MKKPTIRNDVTIVTALFNIEREGMDGREWEEYLKWFEVTLNLRSPMVAFITEDLVDFVKEKRGKLPIEIIVQTIDDIPYYHLKDQIQEILDSEEYKEKMADPGRIECKHAMYSVVQYSKFQWLKQAIEISKQGSDYYFWLDAGASRFFIDNFGEPYNLNLNFPSLSALDSLPNIGEKCLLQMNCDYYKDLYEADELSLDYLWDNRSYVLGSMFGGHKNALPDLCQKVEDVLTDDMIANGNVNNEQIALGYLIKKYKDDYILYERRDGRHLSIFGELSKIYESNPDDATRRYRELTENDRKDMITSREV